MNLAAAQSHAEAKAAAWRLVHGRRPAAPVVDVRVVGPQRVEFEFADRLVVTYMVNGGSTRVEVRELPTPAPGPAPIVVEIALPALEPPPASVPGDEAGAPASASKASPPRTQPKGKTKKAG